MSVDLSVVSTPRLRDALKRAESAYSIARGERKDRGKTVESGAESKARQRRDAIKAELRRRTVRDSGENR